MTKIDLLKASFNAGELSPRLHARTDFIKYPAGLEECRNLIPLPEGGLTRRPGTRFVAETADSTKKGRLFGFEATAEQHHVLELGENIIRFYFRQGQQIVLNTDAVITNGLFPSDINDWDDRSTGGAGNQISHDATNDRLTLETSGTAADDIGWAEQDVITTDLNQETVIKFEVIGDPGDKIEFLVGSSSTGSEILSPVEKLVGYHCVAFTPTTSPFYIQFRNLGINADKDIQIDNISIIDDSALEIGSPYTEGQLFQIMGTQSNDVKYLFRDAVAPYKLERRALASWSLIRVAWGDGPYITQNTTTTTLTPAATSGVAVIITASSIIGINDGVGFLLTDVGRLVRIKNGSEWGWGIIVTFTSTTIVKVHVKKAFAATSANTEWRLGAWSDTTGWPKTGGFFEQRLYVASTDEQSQTLWGSQTGDFENFKPDDDTGTVEADDSLNFTLSADSVNEIRWLSAGQNTLAIGTAGGEWVPSASGIVITPLDITIRRQTTHGSALVAPLRVDHVVLFVQRANRKIREFVFNFEIDSFLAPDITRLAQHITAPGIGEMAFQQEPDSLVWVARSDGVMLSLTFRRDEDVVGWAQHNIGGSGSTGARASFEITGGSESADAGVNTISSITVNGVEVLGSSVDWETSNEVTASLITSRMAGNSGNGRISFVEHKVTDLGVYEFDGTDWAQVGNLFDIGTGAGSFPDGAQAALSETRIAFMADNTGELRTLDFDGTNWVQVGNSKSFVSPDAPAMAALTPSRIAFFDEDLESLETYEFNGTDWTLIGNGLNIPGSGGASMAALSSTRIAFLEGVFFDTHFLRTYDFDGTDWVQVGNALGFSQETQTAVAALSPTRIAIALGFREELRTLDFDGTDWVQVGNTLSQEPGSGTPMCALSPSRVAYYKFVDTIQVFDFDGTDWTEVGNGLQLLGTGAASMTAMRFSGNKSIIFSIITGLWSFTVDNSIVTIASNVLDFGEGGEEVVVTTTGDVTVSQNSFILDSTGVSFSESVVTISGFNGNGQVQNSEDRNEVWTMVKRTINGDTKRYVEFFEGYYDNLLHDQEDAYYADSIITYDGELTDTITGLSHLEGETVKVWGDGAILPDVVVTDGQITLATAVQVAQIGLAYTHRLKTLKIEGGNPAGTAVGKKKRISGITFVLLNSHTLTFGPDDNNKFKTDFRLVSDPMDAGIPLFTGEQFRGFDGGIKTDSRIIVESDDPAPFTLLALIPEIVVNPSK